MKELWLGVGIIILSYLTIRFILIALNRSIARAGLSPRDDAKRKKWKPTEYFRKEALG